MRTSRRVAMWMIGACAALGAGAAGAQGYPEKPVRVFAPVAGSSIDFTLRLIATPVSEGLGQRMVIENRGVIGVELVARAPSDGYTLVCYTNPLWLTQLFRDNVAWDAAKSFSPIILATSTPSVLVVHPSLPTRNVRQLIALAKARPGMLNYASGSTGAATHVAAELFKAMAGVNMVRVNYKGTGTAITDLIAGQVQVMFPSAGAALQHAQSGRLRALAVASPQPSALTPGLPTLAAAGLPGYESRTLTGIFAPAGTAATIIERLNQEFTRALTRPEIQERLFKSSIEVVGGRPEDLAATMRDEMARMDKVVKSANLRE